MTNNKRGPSVINLNWWSNVIQNQYTWIIGLSETLEGGRRGGGLCDVYGYWNPEHFKSKKKKHSSRLGYVKPASRPEKEGSSRSIVRWPGWLSLVLSAWMKKKNGQYRLSEGKEKRIWYGGWGGGIVFALHYKPPTLWFTASILTSPFTIIPSPITCPISYIHIAVVPMLIVISRQLI